MTTLHDRLADLADDAPTGAPDPGLWEDGVRQHRRRQAGTWAAAAAVVVLVVGTGLALGLPDRTDRSTTPADVPFGDLHLPRDVWAPSPWAEGSDELGPPGPLAAVSIGARDHADGLSGKVRDNAVFGVSAVDGAAHWIDLPDGDIDSLGSGALALSPDGGKVGYNVYDGQRLLGWDVYDTTTGRVVRLRDDHQSDIRGTDAFEIGFTGDSRYLETNYSLDGSDGSRDDSFVVWDVETGKPTVAEGTGNYWLPDLGSAPVGVVWSRGHETYTFDPTSGARDTRTVPQDLIQWSDGPAGDAAYIAFGERKKDPWRLYSGDGQQVDIDIDPDGLLGWRDDSTVVVESLPSHALRFVDLRTGESTSDRLRMPDNGADMFLAPVYAADMWANPLVDGVRPPHVSDPRSNRVLIGLGVAGAVVIAGVVLWRRRVRA